MPFDQTQCMDTLKEATQPGADAGEFIYRFMEAYDFPGATITQVRNDTGTRNVASRRGEGHIALRNRFYFMPVTGAESVHEALQRLADEEEPARHRCRFLIVTDFEEFTALDTQTEERLDITLEELPRQYLFFGPLAGLRRTKQFTEESADLKAAAKMGKLFDRLHEVNEVRTAAELHALNVFLTRLLFCYFAEDTGIFPKDAFTRVVTEASGEDGEGLTELLGQLFRVMDQTKEDRSPDLPAHIEKFPYVNGGLFRDDLPVPTIRGQGRRMMIECGQLQWEAVNPDIFGSMFQAVVEDASRDELGQHYTSVPNILKVIRPLFLDGLYAELQQSAGNRKKLEALLERISRIRFFDPAMGSGNFLIIVYKELRRLEMEIFRKLQEISGQQEFFMSGIRLDQFYGIEIDDFAHEIAQLSLWLAEHQMNVQFAKQFGHTEPLLPLKDSAHLVLGNSLRLDWNEVCPNEEGSEVYVCGNPPFVGDNGRNDEQNEDMRITLPHLRNIGRLDYVSCWFWKGAQYVAERGSLAFVSTSSLCQGIQVPMLWPSILSSGVSISFAHQTFSWKNSARGNAGVHVVIIGLTRQPGPKKLYYMSPEGMMVQEVDNISPYLVRGGDSVVSDRRAPLCGSTPILYGSKPYDGGNLILDPETAEGILADHPEAEPFVKRYMGASEFIYSTPRYCLWLDGATEEEIEAIPPISERVRACEAWRAEGDEGTLRQRLAEIPHLFAQRAHPNGGQFILVPGHTSKNRFYVPLGFYGDDTVSSNANFIIPNGTLYDFAVLSTRLHVAWLALVGGRIRDDFRYMSGIVYNAFPWPEASEAQREEVAQLGREVLLARELFPDLCMGDLYDPEDMPDELLQAHQALDEAVERLYRDRPFKTTAERQEYLLARYDTLTRRTTTGSAAKKTRRKRA